MLKAILLQVIAFNTKKSPLKSLHFHGLKMTNFKRPPWLMVITFKQPVFHQTITYIIGLPYPEVMKTPRDRVSGKKFAPNTCPVGHEINIKSFTVEKIQHLF